MAERHLKQLFKEASRYTECVAGYLKLEYNSYGGIEEFIAAENELKNEEDEIQFAVSIHVIPPPVDT